MKKSFIFLSILTVFIFTAFSYTVAKENWQKADFDFTVKLQDHIPSKLDKKFSLLSLLGSVEVTFGIALILVFLALLRLKWMRILGWLMILPASAAEVFGKLVLYHPGPPLFFHRTTLETHLPSFYIHTEFSYPSGHMTRTSFLTTVFILMTFSSKLHWVWKWGLIGILGLFTLLMGITRVSLGEHWLSDVIGGGLLGVGFGLLASVLILNNKKR